MTRGLTTQDGRAFAPGPWDDEPDTADWLDDATGLHCKATRAPGLGMWCGYVAVRRAGWLRRLLRRGPRADELTVHGGITFDQVDVNGVRWIGFDTCHFGDLMPFRLAAGSRHSREDLEAFGDTYKDLAFIKRECARLAAQVARGLR